MRNWRRRPWKASGVALPAFEAPGCFAVCAGIGGEAARRAAEAAIGEFRPERIVSAGFAGALTAELHVADVIRPAAVLDAISARRFEICAGQGTLVSSHKVASRDEKRDLAARFAAQAVDMEGASLAQVASERGVAFTAVKAITDEFDVSLPDFSRFTDSAGRLLRGRLAAFALLRPWWWPPLLRLAADSNRAAQALCRELEVLLQRPELHPNVMPGAVSYPGSR